MGSFEVTDFETVPEDMETLISPADSMPFFCTKELQAKDRKRTNIFLAPGFLLLIFYWTTDLILQ